MKALRKIRMWHLAVTVAGLVLLGGCAPVGTMEPHPPSHPASPDAPEAPGAFDSYTLSVEGDRRP